MQFDSYHFENVTSTMEVIRQLLPKSKGKTQENERGVIVTAGFQREGRGRVEGRVWRAAPRTAMLATIAFPQGALQGELQDDLQGIPPQSIPVRSQVFPLLTGLAVHSVLYETFGTQFARVIDTPSQTRTEQMPRPFLVKWPNDILGFASGKGTSGVEVPKSIPGSALYGSLSYKKLGGILCEAIPGWFLAGIGLNLLEGSYPEELKAKAVCLSEVLEAFYEACNGISRAPEMGISVSPDPAMDLPSYLACQIADKIVEELQNPFWKQQYEENLWAKGARVSFVVGHPDRGDSLTGVVEGIDQAGCLILALPNGEKRHFLAGEITSLEVSA